MKIRIAAICGAALVLSACGDSADNEAALNAPTREEVAAAEMNEQPEGPYAPAERCGELEDFDLFLGDLRRAVIRRNTQGLIDITDENVRLDFGGSGGVDTLRSRLDEDPELWTELNDTVALGCSTDGPDSASFPSLYGNLPDGMDPATTFLVTGNAVPVYAEANASSEQVGTIGWDLVQSETGEGAGDFVAITTKDGKEGFIAADDLRSTMDYRLLANRMDNGEWKMTAFIAGD